MEAGRLPLFERLQIESWAHCNRTCWFCPRTFDRTGKYVDASGASVRSEMPTSKILELLDQARAMGFAGRVAFHHYSEPLLDPRNLDLARAARARGMQPYLVTNGDVLRHDAALCEAVCDVYEHIVVGIYDYEADAELEETRVFWKERIGPVAELEFSPIGRSGSLTARSRGIPRALVPPDRRMSAPDLVYRNAPCHRPLIRMIVQHDGEVANCCEDLHGSFQLGNVYESSLEEIWQSERHARVVADLAAGRRERHALCANCPLGPSGPSPAGERIDFAPRRFPAAVE